MQGFSSIVLIYNSFNDPLFQNIVLSYIKFLAKEREGHEFFLITFEQKKYRLTEETKKKIKKNLAESQIYWYPLTYHSGHLILIKKAYDFLMVFLLICWLKLRYKPVLLFSFTNLAASIGIVISKLLNIKLLVYSYEPHSEFMTDLGVWSKKSNRYRLLRKMETLAGLYADYILTGTKFMVTRLRRLGSRAHVFRAPTSVDESRYVFNPEVRKKVRQQLNIEDRYVIIYTGKFGDLYYKEEIASFFMFLLKEDSRFFFIVSTPDDNKGVKKMFSESGFTSKDLHITGQLSNEELINYLSAADMGLSAVPPSPSQKYRSPTKIAEYLLCGLPYITCRGVSEDDLYAEEKNVGVVLENFNEDTVKRIIPAIMNLLHSPKEEILKRCRETGIEYRGQSNINRLLHTIFDEIQTSLTPDLRSRS